MEDAMKRDLFVFAGQSNMMGASVFPPVLPLTIKNSFEYKHKPRRLGALSGNFVPAGYPVGEFSYTDLKKAYHGNAVNENGESTLENYSQNTYFCPAMSNLKSEADHSVHPFSVFSEATAKNGATLAPFLAQEWEAAGGCCAYAHIAKGGVSIAHYMTEKMSEEYSRRIAAYNHANGTNYDTAPLSRGQMSGAAEYFFEKCKDFFTDTESFFTEDTIASKCFFWLQGEANAGQSAEEYEIKLDILREELKVIGFTHFFCIRVGYWGSDGIRSVMKAQETFCEKHPDSHMLTRAASFFTYPGQAEEPWFVSTPAEEYRNCRDSFYGYDNHHINEKGFSVIARHSAANLYRVLRENREPLLEEENIRALLPQ